MKRRLILMRHAKALPDSRGGDHSRALDERGRKDAARIGVALRTSGWTPDRAVCSDSARTVETWAVLASEFTSEIPAVYRRSLYHAGLGALQRELEGIPDDVGTILVLGHNPGWELAASVFAGRTVELGTAHAALLELQPDPWRDALRATAVRLVQVLRPKDLESGGIV